MCGIFTVVNKKEISVDRQLIEKCTSVIKHRGPDGDGFFIEGRVGLAHRRLSILDLSDAGKQPMLSSGQNLVMTYNGEIYNYLELRAELLKLGHHFRTETDTEVILSAYSEWGEGCVKKFNGMWAFVIYDKLERKIFCSRDRFGVKPLYFLENNFSFAFASEIKQLLPLTEARVANRQSVYDYVFLSFQNHNEETFFKGINKLKQGHNAVIDLDSNTLRNYQYYTLEFNETIARQTKEQAIENYEELLHSSIDLRLRSDVTVGTCLSGGLDSSLIASVAGSLYRQKSGHNFKAITAKSVDRRTDESFYAKQVADYCNLDWHVVEPSLMQFSDHVDKIIELQEEPFLGLSILMQYFVMEKARKSGCVVMLDGQGGDETLLGYERYFPTYLNELSGFSRIKSFLSIAKNSKLTLGDVIKFNFYFRNELLRTHVLKKKFYFLKDAFKEHFNYELLGKYVSSYKSAREVQHMDITQLHLPMLLNYEDRNSMINSIEARVPFVDYRLIEAAYSMPLDSKIHDGWTKFTIRKIGEKHLPNSIAWRKDKLGFVAPQKIWMNENKKFIIDVINKSQFIKEMTQFNNWSIVEQDDVLWKLFNLAKWSDIFQVAYK